MDWSEGKSPRRANGPDGFSPSRREAARREQAQRDNEKRGAVVSGADGLERGEKPKEGQRPGWVFPESEGSRASRTGAA